jgi:hypothetical protein
MIAGAGVRALKVAAPLFDPAAGVPFAGVATVLFWR